MKKNLDFVFMTTVLEKSAWEELSQSFHWTEQLLGRFIHQVNWEKISQNSNIIWTSSMLDKFESYINWTELPKSDCEDLFTEENLRKYEKNWNWQAVSRWVKFSSLTLIDLFIEKWDWSEVINNYSLINFFNNEFLEKYQDYIPASSLEDSYLWKNLEEEKVKELKRMILS